MLSSSRVDEFQIAMGSDLLLFLPELIVVGCIVALLLGRLCKPLDRFHFGGFVAAAVALAMTASAISLGTNESGREAAFFGGMLIADSFAAFSQVLILATTFLTVLLTRMTGIPDRLDAPDFYTLLLGSGLGMLLLVAANHLLMVFIAIEMTSLPGYALAGFLKGQKRSSEAALKYVVYGAGASGVMLYGISLVAGPLGTGYLPDVAAGIAQNLAVRGGVEPTLLFGLAFISVGIGFKIAAVPFHFWCPDVFEGASAEVAGFLSVASKAAAICLLIRILLTIQSSLINTAGDSHLLPSTIGLIVALVGAITATYGNLAAFSQSNLKRLLAYSTIAHAGYMLLAVGLMNALGSAAVLYYLSAYILMNLGAFAVVAFVRNATGSEELSALRGLAWRSPILAIAMAVFIFSLLGFPPLGGFAGKFQVFAAIYEAGRHAASSGEIRHGNMLFALLAVGVSNTVVSAYYYLRIIREIFLEGDEPELRSEISLSLAPRAFLGVLVAGIMAIGTVWNPLATETERASSSFHLKNIRTARP